MLRLEYFDYYELTSFCFDTFEQYVNSLSGSEYEKKSRRVQLYTTLWVTISEARVVKHNRLRLGHIVFSNLYDDIGMNKRARLFL